MPPVKGQMLQYSEDQMKNALDAVARGQPISTAAKTFGVPRSTLQCKLQGKSPMDRQMGPDSILTKSEEKILVRWIFKMADAGFPVGKEQLLDSVQGLVTELERVNPFTNNRPGKKWFESFQKRNPEISQRTPQNLTATRAAVDRNDIQSWFSAVEGYLRDNGHIDILNDSTRVYNADETAFFLNPKGKMVLARKGSKSVYQHVNPDEKECLTVLFAGNAAGQIVEPMIVFKYERIPNNISCSVPKTWGIGKSESGWMTGETFYGFLGTVFIPWLKREKVCLPVIFFVDGHVSHLTLHASRLCEKEGIILVALHPNATQYLQPFDVSVFRTLKDGWKDKVRQWRIKNFECPILKKHQFCPLLKELVEERLRPQILANGFRKCGLVPWSPTSVLKEKEVVGLKEKQQKLQTLESGLHFVEQYIPKLKLDRFKENVEWDVTDQDYSLFTFYKKIAKDHADLHRDLNLTKTVQETTVVDKDVEEALEETIQVINDEKNVEELKDDVGKGVQDVISDVLNYIEKQETNRNDLISSSERNDYIMPSTSFEHIDGGRTPLKSINILSNVIIPPPITQPELSPNQYIPSPFKRALFWPEPKAKSNKRPKKEIIPPVATSESWQKYHANKEEEKKQKRARAEARQQKAEINKKNREEKELQKKYKKNNKQAEKRKNKKELSESSSEEDWIPSESSDNDISNEELIEDDLRHEQKIGEFKDEQLKESDYVFVEFPGKKRVHKYVCVIQEILSDDDLEVVGLVCVNEQKTAFKVNEKDVSVIKKCQVLKKLKFPDLVICGHRLKYIFDEPLDVDA